MASPSPGVAAVSPGTVVAAGVGTGGWGGVATVAAPGLSIIDSGALMAGDSPGGLQSSEVGLIGG